METFGKLMGRSENDTVAVLIMKYGERFVWGYIALFLEELERKKLITQEQLLAAKGYAECSIEDAISKAPTFPKSENKQP